jgi:hypothetical protein
VQYQPSESPGVRKRFAKKEGSPSADSSAV